MSKFVSAGTTRVFWDVDDFPVPGHDINSVAKNIRSALWDEGYRGDVKITAYCDEKNASVEEEDRYMAAGIFLLPHDGDKYASLSVDTFLCAMDYPANHGIPINLLYISKIIPEDKGFVSFLEALKEKHYNVFLAHDDNCTLEEVRPILSLLWRCTSLFNGEKPMDQGNTVTDCKEGSLQDDTDTDCEEGSSQDGTDTDCEERSLKRPKSGYDSDNYLKVTSIL